MANNQMNMGQPVMNNQNSQMFVQGVSGGSMSTHRGGGGYGMWPPPQTSVVPSIGQRSKNSWKNKKGLNNEKWNSNKTIIGVNNSNSSGGYNPPTLNELQQQNRLKARRYFPKKKYNNNNYGGRSAPFAPRNTTSFLIRAKKAGGITSLVSPCPVTPAVLPTPIFSPSREVLVDMAKEEWGVDGYGSMKGLIRLRSPGNGNDGEAGEEDEDDEGGESSESDVEEHVEVERRLDHDLSRFEMIYPNYSGGGVDHTSYNLENRVDDQDTHIAQLEEENLILKERLFLMEREFDDLRMRLQRLERQSGGVSERVNNEEVVENDSDNESESSRGYGPSMEDNNDVMRENVERSQNSEENNNADVEFKQSESSIEKGMQETEHGTNVTTDVCMEEDDTEDIETKKENNNEATAGDDDHEKHVEGFSTKEVEDANKGLAKDE
uniref:uncharacterized protein LOC122581624 n=1 Tax=Erigeron canadensis TaxID=72917 RepID=UPI001CB905B5|nr:uncharacterized protein LOC122581624 [Erigeron canadensis]